VRLIRRKYICQCKGYYTTAWMCHHIMAIMVHHQDLDITLTLTQIPVLRRPGRPTRVGNWADRATESGFFSSSRLCARFLERPASCYGWIVTRERRENDGSTQFVMGRVLRHITGAVYTWVVQYSNNVELLYEAQALAELVSFSASYGVDITSYDLGQVVMESGRRQVDTDTTGSE